VVFFDFDVVRFAEVRANKLAESTNVNTATNKILTLKANLVCVTKYLPQMRSRFVPSQQLTLLTYYTPLRKPPFCPKDQWAAGPVSGAGTS
jgi:hypothetical protein